jgi:hypothetical protein
MQLPSLKTHALPCEKFAGTSLQAPLSSSTKAYSGDHIGAKSRAAYVKFRLFRSASHPPYKIAFRSPFKEAFALMVAAYLSWTAGREVKKSTGKSVITQFREMTALWFGQMIDPPSYYAQELFRPDRLAQSSQYLTRFETKNGILKSINEYFPSPYDTDEMSDKAQFARGCANHNIPHAQTLAVIGQDDIAWAMDPEDLCFDLFCKRQRGKGAIGAEAFKFIGKGQFCGAAGKHYSVTELISHLREFSDGRSILIQRWLRNHDSIEDLAHASLITFRVITCMNEDQNVEVTDAMLRVLADLEPAWKSVCLDGEFAAPISLASGRLGLLTGDNMRTSCKRYQSHPVTHAKVQDRVIEHWPAIAALAVRCHQSFGHRLMIGWDIALTPQGAVVLEGNTKFDVMFLQRVQNRPAGNSRLGQLLELHLQKLQR